MTTKNDSQSQQDPRFPFPLFPMPSWDVLRSETWQRMATDGFARAEAMAEHVSKLEAAGMERAKTSLDDMHRLFHDSMAYMGKMTAEWRNLTLEAMRNLAPQQSADAETEVGKSKKAA